MSSQGWRRRKGCRWEHAHISCAISRAGSVCIGRGRLATAALNELLHILRHDAPAWAAAIGLRDVHARISRQPSGVGGRHHSSPCA